MKTLIAGAAVAVFVATPILAQTAPAGLQPAVVHSEFLTLGAGVPITLAVSQEVNSSTHEEGDIFPLTVLNDVKIGDTVVIPRGTPAYGEITWKTGKGAFGKSGKMEFVLRYIELGGTKIPVTGNYRQEGEGNTIATGVGVIAVGVFAGFITGKRARLPMGRELMAQNAQTVDFSSDGRLASSFDAVAAMTAAEAKLPVLQCRNRANALPEKKREKALKDCYRERME